MPPDDELGSFSVSAFQHALEAASDADLVRMQKIARILAVKTKGAMTPDDLLQESVLRTLEGRRKWNRSVPLEVHLRGVMKSIASHAKNAPGWAPPEADPDNAGAASAVAELVKHFEDKDDDEALLVLAGQAEGKEPKEIRDDLGLEQTRYETIMKSIRRAGERLGVSKGRKTR